MAGAGGTSSLPALAIYWASSCGGCEVSVLNLAERLPGLDRAFRLVFCPCLADFKHDDLNALPDGSIDLCLFNGGIRSAENEAMARLLRRKSRFLVAFGSCAHEGCVPGLANLTTAAGTLAVQFAGGDGDGRVPQAVSVTPHGDVGLPPLFDTLRTLDQVVPVDYFVPGCPPESPRVWEVLELLRAVLAGRSPAPEVGSVLGAGPAAVCEECPRAKPAGPVSRFLRRHEVSPDETTCLIDQGLVCLGPATRQGCGALCPRVSMACEGCYGPPDGVRDVGARMIAALAALSGEGAPAQEEEDLLRAVEEAMATVADPAGTFYRFSLARSILRRARPPGPRGGGGAAP